jgi:hypothetical protein
VDWDLCQAVPSPAGPFQEVSIRRMPNVSLRYCTHSPTMRHSIQERLCAGTLEAPKWTGTYAKQYPFQLDPFQEVSVACIVSPSLYPATLPERALFLPIEAEAVLCLAVHLNLQP